MAPQTDTADLTDYGRMSVTIDEIAEVAERAGLRQIHLLAWRDIADPEAGGSEVHAHEVASIWASAGIDVTMRTSYAVNRPNNELRNGYRVVRKAGRYMTFPRTILSEVTGRLGHADGLVEIWNGMPFFSPVWFRGPRATWLHHIHDEMWDMVLSERLARLGKTVELKIAPHFYRRTQLVTLSESSKETILNRFNMPGDRVTVVPPGIDPTFRPDDTKSAHPTLLAVGRLVPPKHFDLVIQAIQHAQSECPELEATIVGDGFERPKIEQAVRDAGLEKSVRIAGRVSPKELLELYQTSWLNVSASSHEGWGMTVTEAAACGTPSVVTNISGHRDAIVDGVTGVLVDDVNALGMAIAKLVSQPKLVADLAASALAHAAQFSWTQTAYGTLRTLADQCR